MLKYVDNVQSKKDVSHTKMKRAVFQIIQQVDGGQIIDQQETEFYKDLCKVGAAVEGASQK